jgi:hypothetical protein
LAQSPVIVRHHQEPASIHQDIARDHVQIPKHESAKDDQGEHREVEDLADRQGNCEPMMNLAKTPHHGALA